MKSESLLILLCCLGWVVASTGCDLGTPQSESELDDLTGGGSSGGGSSSNPPILMRLEGADDPVRPGDVITLVGFNFDNVIANNQVRFTAGNNVVDGLPINVRVAVGDSGATTALQSTLDVVVPGGVTRGNVELLVRGQSAGAAGVDVAPQLIGFRLGNNGVDADLFYQPALGFQDGASRVTLFGLNFTDVQEVLAEANGSTARRIPSNTFIRNPVQVGLQDEEPSGIDSLAFNLRDDQNDVRLPIAAAAARVDMAVVLRGPADSSNQMMLPVVADPTVNDNDVGAVISGIHVPVGIVTGPVKIHYTCYERIVNAEWQIRVEFRASNEAYDSGWQTAWPSAEDPDNNGNFNILMGCPLHDNGQRLLPGLGAVKTFVWDAPNDPIFREINDEAQDNGEPRPRYWRVDFRLTPIPDTQNRNFIEHIAESPPIVYYDLVDRPGESVLGQRLAEVFEAFTDNLLEDDRATDAIWGPPLNPGLLSGSTDAPETSRFGEGQAVMVLEEVEPEAYVDLIASERMLDEYVVFDTDRMEVIHHVIKLVPVGDGVTPSSVVDSTFPVLFVDEDGDVVANPGKELGEFHLAKLIIRASSVPPFREGVDSIAPNADTGGLLLPDDPSRASPFRVIAVGSRPLVIRLSGGGDTAADEDLVFVVESNAADGGNDGILNLSGSNGGHGSPDGSCPPPPNCGTSFGGGGSGGPGAGAGGRGALLSILNGLPNVQELESAEAGANDGGGPGETPAAVHYDELQTRSTFNGAPGGGGGHRLAGGDGDYGNSFISQYQTPAAGQGGPPRGTPEQVELTGGSGGGGGGASLSRIQGADLGDYFTAAGAGGGGGGGALLVEARGSVLIEGQILANGGDGGNGEIPFYRSPVIPDYPHGVNQIATGGAGGGGSGGSIVVRATGPVDIDDCGKLQVEGGEGGLSRKSGNQNRPAGTGDGAPGYVRLESGGTALPFCGQIPVDDDVLMGGGLVNTSDSIDSGQGRDGVLHLNFIASVDPITGLILDEETGRPLSIWFYDTDLGELTAPDGTTLRTREAGLIDVNRLIIDEDVVLRASGANRLRINARELAYIAGKIDASGFPGGELRFSSPGDVPLPGVGGAPGPGGGQGGEGGDVRYLNGDPTDRASANTIPVDGGPGRMPVGAEALAADDPAAPGSPPDGHIPVTFQPPEGGGSLRGRGDEPGEPCDTSCQAIIDGESAGGGAGGGALEAGEDGEVNIISSTDHAELAGTAGTAFGFDTFRLEGEIFPYGGLGGGGGGASANVSSAYASGGISGRYPYAGTALLAPGTGGGGGGGCIHLVAGALELASSARLLARGGDAYQSIDLGGNGGAGAGGAILIQVVSSIHFADGAVVDVSGGLANRLPPITSEGLRSYEGNVRDRFLGGTPVEDGGTEYGGLGGDGAPGRVRIEAPSETPLVSRGLNLSMTTGAMLLDVTSSQGVSNSIRLGLGPAFSAGSRDLTVDIPRLIFSPLQPSGTDVTVLWEGASTSLDIHAASGELRQAVADPRVLRSTEYIRFRAVFRSNYLSRSSQSLQSLTLPYFLSLSD